MSISSVCMCVCVYMFVVNGVSPFIAIFFHFARCVYIVHSGYCELPTSKHTHAHTHAYSAHSIKCVFRHACGCASKCKCMGVRIYVGLKCITHVLFVIEEHGPRTTLQLFYFRSICYLFMFFLLFQLKIHFLNSLMTSNSLKLLSYTR